MNKCVRPLLQSAKASCNSYNFDHSLKKNSEVILQNLKLTNVDWKQTGAVPIGYELIDRLQNRQSQPYS
jgi:hypothetical protein